MNKLQMHDIINGATAVYTHHAKICQPPKYNTTKLSIQSQVITFLRSLASYNASSAKIGSNVVSSLESGKRLAPPPMILLPYSPELFNFYQYSKSMLFLWQRCWNSGGPVAIWHRAETKQLGVVIILPCQLREHTMVKPYNSYDGTNLITSIHLFLINNWRHQIFQYFITFCTIKLIISK